MTTSVQQLITDALERIGAEAGGETPNATDSQRAFRALNDLLDAWSLERGLVYALTKESLTLTGAESYTIGQDGTPDFNTVRPLQLDDSTYFSTGGLDYPTAIWTREEYMSRAIKDWTGVMPGGIYLDDTYPNATLYVYPAVSGTLVLSSWKPLTAFTSLSQTVALPPGYKRALELSLAEDLVPIFDLPMPKNLERLAMNARRAIKNKNAPSTTMSLPPELIGRARFNILTGR